ncbi:MAG: hypothetical protein N2319_09340 [Candidatus Kapabacteria bacterium]|nr:hypothetical protein [Candidatus Kapabacteria bacterium]
MENKKNTLPNFLGKSFTKITGKKAIIGAFLFAIALWFYTNLNQEFYTTIKIPLKIITSENWSIELTGKERFIKEVPIEVKGNGWQLFNLMFINPTYEIVIDLSNKDIDTIYQISRNDLIDNVKFLGNARAVSTNSPPITIRLGKISISSIEVKPRVKVIPKDGFLLIGKLKVNPDIINIKGNEKIINQIQYWTTEERVFTEVDEPFIFEVPLKDTLSNIITLSQKEVKVSGDIQQIAEMTFFDVPIAIKGRDLGDNHILIPNKFKVTIRSGIDLITKINPRDINLSLDYYQILNDNTGVLIPEISVPENFKVLSIEPSYVYHYVK